MHHTIISFIYHPLLCSLYQLTDYYSIRGEKCMNIILKRIRKLLKKCAFNFLIFNNIKISYLCNSTHVNGWVSSPADIKENLLYNKYGKEEKENYVKHIINRCFSYFSASVFSWMKKKKCFLILLSNVVQITLIWWSLRKWCKSYRRKTGKP